MHNAPVHPLAQEARTWASVFKAPDTIIMDHYSSARDILRARIDSVTIRLLQQGIADDRVRLLDAVLSEIGSNSFDHNIGQWRDLPGVFFATEETADGLLCVLADRGQGIFKTLCRVRPDLGSDMDALRVAFTERVSGRAPEQRGNGLKFVRAVLLEDGIDLWYGSGNAAYSVERRDEQWTEADPSILGCCAILLLRKL